jgi:hypothetical protein
MINLRRNFSIIALVAAFSFFFASCGGKAEQKAREAEIAELNMKLEAAVVSAGSAAPEAPAAIQHNGTPGLQFTLKGNEYSFSGAGTARSGAVVIPASYNGKPVTSIGNGAFRYCDGITSVTIPESITFIGSNAFDNCTGLTSIIIHARNAIISSSAFQGWTTSQIINITGYASESAADTAWGAVWRSSCNATIKYLGED